MFSIKNNGKIKKYYYSFILAFFCITIVTCSVSTGGDFKKANPVMLNNENINSISIKPLNKIHLYENIQIIAPDNSIISDLSNKSMNVSSDEFHKTIFFSNTIETISKIKLDESIDGLRKYNLRVNFQDFIKETEFDEEIISYNIDWGNGDISSFNQIPETPVSYTYHDQGTYNININLTDSKNIKYVLNKNHTFKLSTGKFVQLWVNENKETVAISSAGISGLTLLGIALTEPGKYKLLAALLLFIPLYTRIQKEDVLDQFVRGQIFGIIKTNPGIHYNQIMRELDVKNGTLSYHLHMLEKTGVIKSRSEGVRYKAFYPSGLKFPKEERFRLTELQMKIINIIKENSGIYQRDIAKKIGIKRQTVNYNIKVLQQAGIIDMNKKGRKTCCYYRSDSPDTMVV